MIRIAVPATSANLGVGFDSFGLAIELYNYFEVELSDCWQFENFEERFANEENLFIVAYKLTLEKLGIKNQCCKVKIQSNIPVCRGLGSSASLIVGGIFAANALNGNLLSKKEVLELATILEGHPDNAAPAIYGGLCICGKANDEIIVLNKTVNDLWHIGLWIPDFELSTELARGVLPTQYSRKDVITNVSSAVLAIEALEKGESTLISTIMNDTIHEPYRQKLIKGFDEAKSYALSLGVDAFIISGSGSTCLSISKKDLPIQQYRNWQILNRRCSNKGAFICQKDI